MKLTKYSHACFVLEKNDSSLIVDPGNWTNDLVIPPNVVGVVITHEHADHCDAELLTRIVETNPKVTIYTPTSVAPLLSTLPARAVSVGETVEAGDFTLSFVGGEHALIHASIPRIANLGVIVDDSLYYPGDSFALPDRPIKVVAVPASAPWMKFAEAMDFIAAVKPARAFPTHDVLLSEIGISLLDSMLGSATEANGGNYERIALGSSIDI